MTIEIEEGSSFPVGFHTYLGLWDLLAIALLCQGIIM